MPSSRHLSYNHLPIAPSAAAVPAAPVVMAGGESLVLPPGCRDGKLALLVVSVLGEFMQGASRSSPVATQLPADTARRL